jgi:hypothetical protein
MAKSILGNTMQRWIRPVQFTVVGFTTGYFIRKLPPFQPDREILRWSHDHVVIRENWKWDCHSFEDCVKMDTGELMLYKRDERGEVWRNQGGGLSVFPSPPPGK